MNRFSSVCPAVIVLVVLAAWPWGTLSALPDDREQEIKITADQALRNEKDGMTVYKGNVELSQGSLHISADKITIYRVVEEADRIVAKGRPAEMQQQPDPEKAPIRAQAEIIEYYKDEARVHLKQDAQIEQEGSRVTGETIDYYIDEQLVKAGSNSTREDSRVEVVIPAQAVQKNGADNGATDSQ
jgi:lipopolysaccharide export system protein LptA